LTVKQVGLEVLRVDANFKTNSSSFKWA
jgi:hypothetical protein